MGGSLDYLSQSVCHAERVMSISSYELKGMHILPFLRHQSILAFRNGDKYNKQVLEIPRQSFAGRLKSLIPFRLETNPFENTQVLFYDPHFKSVEINGKKYNPFLDPFLEVYDCRGVLTTKTSFQWSDSFSQSIWTHPITEVEKDGWLPRFLRSYPTIKDETTIDSLIASWKKETGIEINKSHLLNAIFRAAFTKHSFIKLLEGSKVEMVFFECYYKPEVFGLIAAARSLGIKTIDIQHGKQGTHHLMYSHWSAAPEGGFNTVPDEFWNWGEESVENIRSSSSVEFLKNHKPRVVGFPWLDKCREQLPFTLDENQQGFLKRLSSFDSRILITLQPETVDNEGAIPTELLDAILTMKENIAWLIRLHPSMKQLPNRYDSLLDVENVFIEIPTALPLYVLLNHSTHHITKFSSVAFEANAFNVPTLIIGQIGASLYKRQFNRKEFMSSLETTIAEFVDRDRFDINMSGYFKKFEPNSIEL